MGFRIPINTNAEALVALTLYKIIVIDTSASALVTLVRVGKDSYIRFICKSCLPNCCQTSTPKTPSCDRHRRHRDLLHPRSDCYCRDWSALAVRQSATEAVHPQVTVPSVVPSAVEVVAAEP